MLDQEQTAFPQVGDEDQRTFSFNLTEEARADVAETRTIEISVSSETPVERWFGNEILDHGTKAVDLKFLNSGTAPLLLDHDRRQQIGVVEKAWLDGKKIRARVRMSRGAMAQEVLDDIADGIRGNVSIGYRIRETVVNEKKDEARVTKWSPYEVSFVAIPADPSVGVGRAAAQAKEQRKMADPVQTEEKPEGKLPEGKKDGERGTSTVQVRDSNGAPREVTFTEAQLNERAQNATADRNAEVAEIMSLGAIHNMSDKAREYVKDGKSLREFTGYVRENIDPGKPLVNQSIGLTEKETKRFSLIRLASAYDQSSVSAQTRAVKDAEFELECVRAAIEADKSGVESKGVRMPQEVMENWIVPGSTMARHFEARRDAIMFQRDLNTSDDSSLVPQDYRAGSFIDVLRSMSGPMRAGATMLQGLSGDVDIPKKLTASAPTWVDGEGTNATESEPTFGLVSLRPKDIAVYTDMTRRMRQQASPDIENLVRMDLMAGIALGIDLGALEGTNANGQPEGVLNVTGIGKPTAFAGVNPTFAEVVALETAVAEDNALMGSLAYIGRANMRGALKTTTKDAGSGQFVLANDQANGYPYLVSNQITDGNLYFGNWSDLLIGMWGTLDLQIDPFALALSGGLRMIAFQTVDVAVRHAQSFAYNNDTP